MGELESLRVFLAVAKQGSFAGAARQLAMTPASVTRTVAALEESLGVQLLIRTTRQVSLTGAGAVYAARVAPLSHGLSEAIEETREAQGIASGVIRISAPMSLGVKILPPVLSQFATLYPQTHVSLTLSDSFVDIVEGDYDLAIRVSGPPDDKSTIWRKIRQVPRVVVAAPGYLSSRGLPQSPDDLTEHSCLSYGAQPEHWEFSKGPGRRTHRATGAFSSNNGDLLARLVVNGEGIAFLPRFIVDDDLSAGRLVEVLQDWDTPPIWLTLYYPPYEKLPLRVATFSDFFEGYCRESGAF